jgi:hypothetical protein
LVQKYFKKKVNTKDRFFMKRPRVISPMKHLAEKLRLLSPKNPKLVRKIMKRDTPSQNIADTIHEPIREIIDPRFIKEWTLEHTNLIAKIEKKVRRAKASRFGGFNSPSVLQRRLEFETSLNHYERNMSTQNETIKNIRSIRRSRVLSEGGMKNGEYTQISFLSL